MPVEGRESGAGEPVAMVAIGLGSYQVKNLPSVVGHICNS
jgi:hypothetical protein